MFIGNRDEDIRSLLNQFTAELIEVATVFDGALCEPVIEFIVKVHPIL